MVKVKMDYNPYLMETKVKFNNKEPRINSLIEKYYQYPIQMWVEHIPRILYDEMNGYDFDLEFSGTELDYNELVSAFNDAGITSDEVRCIHERIMEGRVDKLREINELNQWLEDNRNERLDLDAYISENNEIFDNSYSLIIIGDTSLGDFSFDYTSVSEEVISDLNEIDNTELIDTPIIFEAESISISDLQSGITSLVEKNDVREEQIFFYIKSRDNAEKYRRMIMDLGIKDPQVILSLEEDNLVKYFELYPVSDYIRKYVLSIREKVEEIEIGLKQEKEASDKANSEVIEQLSDIENRISTIKESIQDLKDLESSNIETDWETTKDGALENVRNWKSKKTKITSNEEAIRFSEQFEEELKLLWGRFSGSISNLTMSAKQDIFYDCTELYEKGSLQTVEGTIELDEISDDSSGLSGIKDDLVEIKEEKYEKPKEGLLNALLKTSSTEEKEDVLVITYPCQKWREHVLEIISPMIDKMITERKNELGLYRKRLIEDYKGKLERLLSERIEEKNSISNRLSEDIKKLQSDIDWLSAFREKLEQVERG